MATVVFGLSFQAEAGPFPPHQHHQVAETEPGWVLSAMTRIFRLAFRSMFSEVRVFQPPAAALQTPAATVGVRHCAAYRASTADIHGRSAPDFLLVVVLDVSPTDRTMSVADVWQPFRSVDSKISLLERCGLKDVVHSYSVEPGRIVGQNSFVVPDAVDPDPELLSSVFAFYFLAWLTCLRVERSQLRTELTVGAKALKTSGWRIANQRLRILNLSRYFLTQDRTNDAAIKAICVALSTKFKLQIRYERALSLHREFEHHLDNNAKIVQSQQLGSVSNLLLILTLLSVPISFFGAVVAVNFNSDAFTAPMQVLLDYRIYFFLALGLTASLIPFALLKIRDIIRSRR